MRRQLALHKICDDTIRNSMLNYLSDNMKEYSYYHENYQENIYDFSWEGFISKNESNINNFRNILLNFGIEKSSREILNVMESSRYKNLLNYHKHNYRPGHALISGWITELPFQILREIKDLESFNGYIKILNETYQKDLTLIVDSLASSKFKRLASSILEKKLSLKINIDPLLKEYALNKTNVDQNCFKDTHITNTDLGFIYIHRMTKNCEKYLNIFKKFSAKLEKISNSIESNSKNLYFQNIYKSYPDLQKPIDLALDLKNEISKILKS
jgi:hypothetical protein